MKSSLDRIVIRDLMASSGVAFGTSGARGLVAAMTDRVCFVYTAGFLRHLETEGAIRAGDAVAVAGDLRPSTPRILSAVCRAVEASGYRPVNCGAVPTPALAAYAIERRIAGVMVTGSHIPDDRNGIKYYRPDGEVLKRDERAIGEQAVRVEAQWFDAGGGFVTPREPPAEDVQAARDYVSRYLDFMPPGCLEGQRVVVYEHSTVARAVLAQVLDALGAEVLCRARSQRFVPVDTEAIRAQDVALARDWAAAEHIDAIVSADGDGDRPLVGDERGVWLRGDVAGILTARHLRADAVVTPVSSNTALEASGWFPSITRTRIGSPYVIEGMAGAAAGGARRVVGYEANGGFLTWHDVEHDGRVLPALPTRDALIVILAVLHSARRRATGVSALCAALPQRYTASDRLREFPTDLGAARVGALRAGGAAAVEALFPALGMVESIDETDGLRVRFASGEIVHLRPSGNAPELRCYTEAGDEDRATALNRECLAILERWRADG